MPTTQVTTVHTSFGAFDTWGCSDPESRPVRIVTIIYFLSYTLLSAYVILSLFIFFGRS